MIGFSEFLTESKSAPLYHGTSIMMGTLIIKEDTLRGKKQGGVGFKSRTSGQTVIFCTRDKRHGEFMASTYAQVGVLFEIDQLKLAQKYKVTPIQNWQEISRKPMYMVDGDDGNEFEEIIDAPKVDNFHKYILSVKFFIEKGADLSTTVEKWMAETSDILDKRNIKYTKVVV